MAEFEKERWPVRTVQEPSKWQIGVGRRRSLATCIK